MLTNLIHEYSDINMLAMVGMVGITDDDDLN